MHRVRVTLLPGGLAVGLMLGGCVAASPCNYNPASCYPPPPPQPYPYSYGYPSDAPPGPPPGPPPGQAYVGPDGFTYVDGYPVDVIDNQQVELVFVPTLGGWGYYDGERRWRDAPPELRGRLDRAHPDGRGLPPPGGFRPGGGQGPGPSRGTGQPDYGGPPSAGPPRQGYLGPGPGPGPASYGGNRPGGGPQGQPPQGRPPQGQVSQGQAFQGRAPGGPAPERREPPRDRECQRGQQRC